MLTIRVRSITLTIVELHLGHFASSATSEATWLLLLTVTPMLGLPAVTAA